MSVYDVKAKVERGEWQRGSKHVRIRVGFATMQDDGTILVTLNSIPVGHRWDGTLILSPAATEGDDQ